MCLIIDSKYRKYERDCCNRKTSQKTNDRSPDAPSTNKNLLTTELHWVTLSKTLSKLKELLGPEKVGPDAIIMSEN
jgi:hypothetical protein